MSEEVLFESESILDRADIAEFLQTVAERLEAGESLALAAGGHGDAQAGQSVTLDVPARATFEVKAEREGAEGDGEYSVEFEIEWRERDQGTEGDSGELSIE